MSAYVPDRGHVVWLDFSPQAGHEQAKRRPALVLSPRAYNAAAGFAFVCPITTKAKGYGFEVPIPTSMTTQGLIISDQLRSLDWRARRAEFAEPASSNLVDEVLARIAPILGLY